MRSYFASLSMLFVLTTTAMAQERTADINVTKDVRVHIYSPNGGVRVSGWDRNLVSAYGSRGQLRDLEIAADGPQRVTIRSRTGTAIDVRVPTGAQVIVECGSGSIEINGVAGTVEAESSSGTLQIQGAPRSISANGISGGVTIVGGGTEITHAESVSGSVVITDARGVVDARSSSGGVQVSGRVRDAKLFSVTGSVAFNGTVENGGRLSAESSSASVELRLPSNTPAEYELSTVSGDIDNDFGPAATRSQNGNNVVLRFSVGGGGARVKAATVSGSIRLTNR